ncbi:enoyl-CoA hydratase-related protein [Neobacillus sp. NRS-1170]|uniref:enoyl-CoA hydratase-related protein n=1 Tax=Neobacillus sp. NRS-1170 TaxID=3233898 RepID=UPI003D2BB310
MKTICLEQNGPIFEIVLNRPEKRNAIDHTMIMEIDAALRTAEQDLNVRVVLFRAESQVFSAGHDLSGTAERPLAEERLDQELEEYYKKTLYIRDYSKPTIAVVQGACIAAGLMISQACDLVIATPNAYFSNPVARMGGVAAEVLFEPWDMGIRRAKQFLFTGDPLPAHVAMQFGMVNEVVDSEKALDRARELAAKIAAIPPITLRLLKKSLNHTQDIMGARESFEYHFIMHELGHTTEESQRLLYDARKDKNNLKQFLKQRDEKYVK